MGSGLRIAIDFTGTAIVRNSNGERLSAAIAKEMFQTTYRSSFSIVVEEALGELQEDVIMRLTRQLIRVLWPISHIAAGFLVTAAGVETDCWTMYLMAVVRDALIATHSCRECELMLSYIEETDVCLSKKAALVYRDRRHMIVKVENYFECRCDRQDAKSKECVGNLLFNHDRNVKGGRGIGNWSLERT